MKNFRVATGRLRAPLRGALAAVLTLYVFNIYPRCCFAEGITNVPTGSLTIDALFDFEVPVGVVSQGIADAYGEMPDNFEDIVEGVFERNGWNNGWEELTEAEWGIYGDGTNGINTNGMKVIGGTNKWDVSMFVPTLPYGVFNSNALNAIMSSNVITQGGGGTSVVSSLPNFSFENLPAIWGYLNSDAPPSNASGLPSAGVVDSVAFSSFWVDHLSMNALQNFDGGYLDRALRNLPRDGVFQWVMPVYQGTCDEFVLWVSDHPNGVRLYVRYVAVILYWVALYKYLIKRVVFVVQSVFDGSGSSGG